ncbi:K+/H+ antiporter YhaU, regulatory subunit KhtT [Halorubrum xinjiangense]|uniref:K+/H+ antiporter YhaU, regulatory subunit KhtT n=1 Tax=Halorubrum xinjiangense TaxID=261291 RepID=A0A1G7J634_9EURY|nr:potassium transporter TrkA [Halorubrum xinjiangense]SDF20390.1 K+/H+ antiporter YhaU, regulatory subunit KhtT [Halorubrum xinjiangense]
MSPALAAAAVPDALAAVVDAGVFAGGLTVAAVDVGFARPRQAAVTLVTFAVVAALVAGGAALAYRWYFRTEIPEGVTGLIGVSVVALYLNTTSLGSVAIGDNPALLAPESVFFNLVSLGVAAVLAPVGRYAGDRLAVDVFALSGAKQLEGELSGIVRAVGRFTAVTLPPADDIGDMDTYDPVSPEKKAELAETTLLFPRKLSAAELRERLVARLKDEYGVGYVDLDLDEDGTVEYFAVGSRAAGLGPTLAPGSAAVAVAADPPNNATVGDTVQLWRDDPEPKRVATGELRGVAGDAVTVALDESDAERLTAEGGYRLVTLPAEPQADREFASLLRTADETMASVAVGAESDLDGSTVGEVGAVVAAVRPAEGSVQPIPPRAYAFGAGDLVYLVGRPGTIRRFEAAAASPADADGADGTAEPASAADRDAELDDLDDLDDGTDFDAEAGPDDADGSDDGPADGSDADPADGSDADGADDDGAEHDGTQRS